MKGPARINELLSIVTIALLFSQDCNGFAFVPARLAQLASSTASLMGIRSRNSSLQSQATETPKRTSILDIMKLRPKKAAVEEVDLPRVKSPAAPVIDTLSYQPKLTVSADSIITEAEVLGMHKAWGDGLCSIAKTFEVSGYDAAKEVAQNVLDAAYGYAKDIPVLFKPTLASGAQTFRLTNEGALSYFVGGNPTYPNDTGFAIQGWRKVESFPAGILLLGNSAISMGHVHCTNKDGKTTIVEKTWAYKKDDAGNVRIVLHHSSLPYSA